MQSLVEGASGGMGVEERGKQERGEVWDTEGHGRTRNGTEWHGGLSRGDLVREEEARGDGRR